MYWYIGESRLMVHKKPTVKSPYPSHAPTQRRPDILTNAKVAQFKRVLHAFQAVALSLFGAWVVGIRRLCLALRRMISLCAIK